MRIQVLQDKNFLQGEHNIGYSVTIQDSMIDNQKLKE